MWCVQCHAGSENADFERCPQCGCCETTSKRPFPPAPTRMGSGPRNDKKEEGSAGREKE